MQSHRASHRSIAHLRQLALGVAVTLLFVAGGPMSAALGATTIRLQSAPQGGFYDDFSRTTSSGWGTASSGQAYSSSPPNASRVDGQAGMISLTPGLLAVQTPDGVSALDGTFAGTFWADGAVTAGNGVTFSLGLRANGGSQYQARARLATAGRLVLSMSRYDASTGVETALADDSVVAQGLRAGLPFQVEFALTGTNPVQLRARAWLAGAPQPDWQATAADSSAQRLTTPGQPSISAYLSRSSTATAVRVDDLSLQGPGTTGSGQVGSLSVGSARYPVPQGAVFAVPTGQSTGSGTEASPYGSAQFAIDRATAGGTVVLRGGTYHEFIYVPRGKRLTIQAYPGEAVWFDGASTVTGWVQSGSSWVVSNWNYDFDYRVSFSKGVDESSRFLDPAHPMAGYPDQVWIDGVAQRQVGSSSQVVSGTFFVDRSGNRLILGTNPSGKRVEASTLEKAIQVHAEDTVLRGFGVRRYANTLSLMGAVSTEVPRATLENLVITQNATAGLYAWATGHTFRNLTVSDNGLMGLGANTAHGLTVSKSVFSGNNTELFKWAPVSGGVKITKSEGVKISGNVFAGNTTVGLWFDDSAYDVKITGNVLRNNSTLGLLVEASDRVVVADNYALANGKGIVVFNAGNVDIWNNTLSGNSRTLEFMQDERRQTNSAWSERIPWVMRNVTVNNNVLSYGSGACPILTQDLTLRWYGNDFGVKLDGNLYHRASSTNPSNFACWANGAAGTRSFKTLDEFRTHTGGDRNSAAVEGSTPLTAAFAVTAPAAATPGLSARGLPTAVASAVGYPAGTARIGALSPYPG